MFQVLSDGLLHPLTLGKLLSEFGDQAFDLLRKRFCVILHHLAPTGLAGFVLANGSMSSNQSGKGEIRKSIIGLY